MIMKLEFDDEKPEDMPKFLRASSADNLCYTLHTLGERLRRIEKYWPDEDFNEANVRLEVEELRSIIFDANLANIYN